jgi:gas vesicle protein
MKSGNVLLGVLAGVAAGALLGILMAPEKGSKTRKQISELGDDLTDNLKSGLDQLVSSFKTKFENDLKSVERITTKVKAITEDSKKEVLNGTV